MVLPPPLLIFSLLKEERKAITGGSSKPMVYRLLLGFLLLIPLRPCALDSHEAASRPGERRKAAARPQPEQKATASRRGERRKVAARPQPEQKMKEAGKSTNGAGTGRRKAKATAVARPQPEQGLECPRCHSLDTKFCYYNNYNVLQPRYHCRGCERYWTVGGALRNVPVGGGRRNRNKRPEASSSRDKLPAAPPASTSMSMSMADFPNFISSPPPGIGELPMATTDLMLPSSNNPVASSSSFLDVLRSGEGLLDAGMLHNQKKNNAGAGIGMAMPLPTLSFGIGGTTPMMQPTAAFQGGEELGGGGSSSSVGVPMSTMGLLNWQPQLNGVNGGAQQLGVNGVTAMGISNTTNGGQGSSRDCYLINNNNNGNNNYNGGLWQSLMNDSSLM